VSQAGNLADTCHYPVNEVNHKKRHEINVKVVQYTQKNEEGQLGWAEGEGRIWVLCYPMNSMSVTRFGE
jgi:hypothetical protein